MGGMMLSEEEKKHITEKVLFEKEVGQQFTRSFWFNLLDSKIALLLIGALITGLLVPTIQRHQEAREWNRQNRWAKINFQLEKMRECLRELTYLHAYAGEAYGIVESFLETDSLKHGDYEEFEQQYLDLQKRRFRQNASVRSLFIYFPNPTDLDNSFKHGYQLTFQQFMRKIKHFMSQTD